MGRLCALIKVNVDRPLAGDPHAATRHDDQRAGFMHGFNRRKSTAITMRILLGVALMIAAAHSSSTKAEEDGVDAQLIQCSSIVSFDKRLLMEQWAKPGSCSRPVRTRIVDQFLGFTCSQQSPEVIACRSFIPVLDSRTLNTAKAFRCVDVALTDADGGVAISRMREWAAAPQQCDWEPYAGVLAMEIDFEHSEVCVAAFCVDIGSLSPIGHTRLRRLITSAFKQLNLTGDGDGVAASRLAGWRSSRRGFGDPAIFQQRPRHGARQRG